MVHTEGFENAEHLVEPNEVAPCQRPMRVIGAQLHGTIDVLRRGNLLLHSESGFVDEGGHCAGENAASGIADHDERFPQTRPPFLCGLYCRRGGASPGIAFHHSAFQWGKCCPADRLFRAATPQAGFCGTGVQRRAEHQRLLIHHTPDMAQDGSFAFAVGDDGFDDESRV